MPALPEAAASPYLGLGEAESRGQLHPLGRGEVALDLEALLQAGELRVGEDGAGFAAAAVLPGQLGGGVGLEQGRHRHSWGDTRRTPGLRPASPSHPRRAAEAGGRLSPSLVPTRLSTFRFLRSFHCFLFIFY